MLRGRSYGAGRGLRAADPGLGVARRGSLAHRRWLIRGTPAARPVDLGMGGIAFGDPGYRDALCPLLAEPVVQTHEKTGMGLVVGFESGKVIIHPSRDDLDGPEIAKLSGFDDGAWMVWRPGEDSFEDLA